MPDVIYNKETTLTYSLNGFSKLLQMYVALMQIVFHVQLAGRVNLNVRNGNLH